MKKIEQELIQMEETLAIVEKAILMTSPLMQALFLFTVFLVVLSLLTFNKGFNKKFFKLKEDNEEEPKMIKHLRLAGCLLLFVVLVVLLLVQMNKDKLKEQGIDPRMYTIQYTSEVEKKKFEYIDLYIGSLKESEIKEVVYNGVLGNKISYNEGTETKEIELETEYSQNIVENGEIYILSEEAGGIKHLEIGDKINLIEYNIETESKELIKIQGKGNILGGKVK